MLRDIIGEVVSSVVTDLLSPSTDRGGAWFNLALSVTAVGLQAFTFATIRNPVLGPEWAFGSMLIAMLLGIVALVISAVSLARHEDHRAVSGIPRCSRLPHRCGPCRRRCGDGQPSRARRVCQHLRLFPLPASSRFPLPASRTEHRLLRARLRTALGASSAVRRCASGRRESVDTATPRTGLSRRRYRQRSWAVRARTGGAWG